MRCRKEQVRLECNLMEVTFSRVQSEGDGWKVFYQELDASEGQVWDVGCYIKTAGLETPAKSSSWLELQFKNSVGGDVGGNSKSAIVSANQDWTEVMANGYTAPSGTAKIAIRGVVYVEVDDPAGYEFHVFDDFSAVSTNLATFVYSNVRVSNLYGTMFLVK